MTTTRNVSNGEPSTDVASGWAGWLARRRLTLPALLFLDAHAPLRFLAGQTLVVAAPVAALLGLDAVQRWADVLSNDEAFTDLRRTLAADQQEPS